MRRGGASGWRLGGIFGFGRVLGRAHGAGGAAKEPSLSRAEPQTADATRLGEPGPPAAHPRPSILEPLRVPVFRALWLAGIVSNVGTWMQNVGGAWFMAELTTSPTMVALMQTATSLPVFLVGLPAGALADVVDRRRLLLLTQIWMLAAALVLSALAFLGRATPELLLGATFALGLGAALGMPAWQAVVPEVVPARAVGAAIALSSVSVNIARALGPTLAGLTLAVAGAGTVFLLNALSFLAVIAAVARWRRPAPVSSDLPVEDFGGAIRAGWRYVRHSAALHAVLVRAALFVVPAAALWSLLPVVARHDLGLTAIGFGALQGSLGAGALVGATLLPRFQHGVSAEALASASTGVFAAATLGLGLVHDPAILCAAMVFAGVAWVAIMAGFNVAVLTGAPRWVQARAVAVFMLIFQGGMAIGSACWGTVAEHLGNGVALTTAAATLALGSFAARRFRLPDSAAVDLSPSVSSEPVVVTRPDPDDGPVLVLIEYRVAAEEAESFLAAMKRVRPIRLRDGAIRWDLFHDPADPGRHLEAFITDSWAEHLRQHQRITVSDRVVIERARSFHRGESPPIVSHFVAEQVSRRADRGR